MERKRTLPETKPKFLTEYFLLKTNNRFMGEKNLDKLAEGFEKYREKNKPAPKEKTTIPPWNGGIITERTARKIIRQKGSLKG
jgi:hypothetical protein